MLRSIPVVSINIPMVSINIPMVSINIPMASITITMVSINIPMPGKTRLHKYITEFKCHPYNYYEACIS